MSERNAKLFTELDVRGRAADGMSPRFAERLGRGLATLARRHGQERTTFVIGREPGEQVSDLRDGLVRGVLLSAGDVIDVGVVDAKKHEFAMIHLARTGGVLVTGGAEDACGFEILLGGGPLVGPRLAELRDVVLAGDFRAGEGTLALEDVEPAYREAERSGHVPGLASDTQVL
jgi:phosphomannomutase